MTTMAKRLSRIRIQLSTTVTVRKSSKPGMNLLQVGDTCRNHNTIANSQRQKCRPVHPHYWGRSNRRMGGWRYLSILGANGEFICRWVSKHSRIAAWGSLRTLHRLDMFHSLHCLVRETSIPIIRGGKFSDVMIEPTEKIDARGSHPNQEWSQQSPSSLSLPYSNSPIYHVRGWHDSVSIIFLVIVTSWHLLWVSKSLLTQVLKVFQPGTTQVLAETILIVMSFTHVGILES